MSLVQSKGRRGLLVVVVVVVLDPTIRLLHTTWVVGMRTCWDVCVCVLCTLGISSTLPYNGHDCTHQAFFS